MYDTSDVIKLQIKGLSHETWHYIIPEYFLKDKGVRLFVITLSNPLPDGSSISNIKKSFQIEISFYFLIIPQMRIRIKTRDSFTLRGSSVLGKPMDRRVVTTWTVYFLTGVNQISVPTS